MKKITTILSALLLMIMFVSCSSDDNGSRFDNIDLTKTEKTLFSKDTHQIDAASISEINYKSENEYHADVSSSGLVTARFVGETNIELSNSEDNKNFKVIVKPEYSLYPEPNVEFGVTTKSDIITTLGEPDAETEDVIGYSDYSNAAPILMFMFDSNDKITSYITLVKTAFTSDLASFLIERYLLVSAERDFYLFINGLNLSDATKAMSLQVRDLNYLQVIYMPSDLGNRLANNQNLQIDLPEFKEVFESLEKQIIK